MTVAHSIHAFGSLVSCLQNSHLLLDVVICDFAAMSSAQGLRFACAADIDAWVAAHFPTSSRKWNDNFQRYLRESAKEQRAKCKPDDGPSLQDCCAVFKDTRITFREHLRSTDAQKKKNLAACISDSLLAYRSSIAEGGRSRIITTASEPTSVACRPNAASVISAAGPSVGGPSEKTRRVAEVGTYADATPAKRLKCDGDAYEDAFTTPIAAATPHARGLNSTPNAGAALASPVSATRLSESSARRIAQSVRKSPLLADGASPCYDSVKAIVQSRSFAAEVVSKERRLLDAVRVPVREIYKFVKQKRFASQGEGRNACKGFQSDTRGSAAVSGRWRCLQCC